MPTGRETVTKTNKNKSKLHIPSIKHWRGCLCHLDGLLWPWPLTSQNPIRSSVLAVPSQFDLDCLSCSRDIVVIFLDKQTDEHPENATVVRAAQRITALIPVHSLSSLFPNVVIRWATRTTDFFLRLISTFARTGRRTEQASSDKSLW